MGHLVVSPPSEMITSCGEMYCYMMIWSIHSFYHQYCYKNHAVSKMDTRSHKKMDTQHPQHAKISLCIALAHCFRSLYF
jgi:hypothetical protein